ncbi:BamA/TamA family outer membrane protein [Imperialibacter roseus]|uniref:BamA/TamA family outer membrane protein n=1 Tax=Imperialibacter roseus TaxID=1324217 RepID=A0ABZ0ISI4_9BACT|nr:BamA/TamA family outer membrane protein [Imperialibacter roseus]WOK07467.1 BamA/TamA family outer membrane protein [Imperialibacter roseus]
MKLLIKISVFFMLSALLGASSCRVKKYIPEDELLYTGSKIDLTAETKVDQLSDIEEELETVMRPEPNSKILGVRLGLLAHYKAQRKHPGLYYRFLNKKIGEEPVYLSDVNPLRVEELVNNRLENRGFFRSEISSVEKKGKHTGSVKYTVHVDAPYTIKSYQLDSGSLPIYKEISKYMNRSGFVKPGGRFDLERFKVERDRIDFFLKDKGYYNFNADFLIFEADTNGYNDKSVDLYLRLKRDVPHKSVIPYEVASINVFPHYSLNEGVKNDTVALSGINYIQDSAFFQPRRLAPYILLEKGKRYNPTDSRRTSNRLSSIGSYKFVNIQYDEVGEANASDSLGQLATNIYLSPLKKRALRAELQGVTKSNNFVGPSLSLTYSNRNLFRGGETLSATGKAGYEQQLIKGDNTGLKSIQLGLKGDLVFPRLLFPVEIVRDFKYAVPKTKFSTGVEYLNRSKLYVLQSLTSTFGYSWNATRYVYHELNPISINFVNLAKTTPEFDAILAENDFLRSSFDQKFIGGLTYTFTYNELMSSGIRNPFFVTLNVDMAGNGLGLLNKLTSQREKNTFFGLEYAQYYKSDINVQYYGYLSKTQKLVARVFAGFGFPFGNSVTLPFSKQYFSGGPYSVRAFRVRSLGPGTYKPDSESVGSFFDQAGDIRLEANLEYRFPIYSFLKGAVFADAGNVWLTNENASLPGGKFTSDFIRELGVGFGTGLRVDIQNFVIRLDLAAPIQKPYLPKGERFGFDWKNPVLNFAIGYPF